MSRKNNIELRSEDFNDVLGSIPPWILRWGITMIAIIVVILLIGSSIFKYPDTINSSVSLTSTAPVVSIVSKTSGKLQKFYVVDNQFVSKGDYLAIIENPTRTEDILELKKYLEEQENFSNLKLVSPNYMQLGNLQSLYASFYLSLFEYKQFLDVGYHQKKTDYVEERIKQNEKYYKNILRQQQLIEEQHRISEIQYKRDSSLTNQGAFSKKELENSYNLYLQSQLSVENMNTTIDNLEVQITQLEESLFDTQYQYIEKKNALENQLRTLMSQLLTEIETWEMTYVLSSPISGKITFTEYWVENQNISAGDITFNIVPKEKGKLIGKALLPTERSGKVSVGQKVNIKFANFPENEYGIVRGYVKNISLVPSKEGEIKQYVVEISLPDGLLTTYKKELPFLPEMEGQAAIITNDITLLERFLLPLKRVISEGL